MGLLNFLQNTQYEITATKFVMFCDRTQKNKLKNKADCPLQHDGQNVNIFTCTIKEIVNILYHIILILTYVPLRYSLSNNSNKMHFLKF